MSNAESRIDARTVDEPGSDSRWSRNGYTASGLIRREKGAWSELLSVPSSSGKSLELLADLSWAATPR